MKKQNIFNFLIILFSTITLFTFCAYSYSKEISKDLYDSFIRLHIIANSDSNIDQKIKLKIRDEVIKYIETESQNFQSTKDAKEYINNHQEEIKEIANKILKENNLNYTSEIVMGDFEFPTKNYGNISLPSGKYQAVRILLGEAKGKNWWCVMFPPLCFVNNENGEISDTSKNQIKNNLSNEEYNLITKNDTNVKFKFKIVEIFK